jgi:transposase
MKKRNKAVSKGIRDESTGEKAAVRMLNLGLDLHYRQVTAGMQEDGGRITPTGKMCYERFISWVEKKLAEGWEIHSCYEAGASGYWLHRDLVAMGVKNLVVAPKPMDKGGKKQKSDKRDGVQLCDALERYLRGQDKALSVVSVPTPEQEQNRALIRYHRQIISDRVRCEARGKGLLCAQGIEIQGQWWQGAGWDQVQKHPRLRAWMKEQLDGWRSKILSSIEEEKPLRERVQALAPALLPVGLGAYSAAVLKYEMRDWARFKNARAVASYTGLCPGIHISDGRGKEGTINRCGNPRVRWILVEAIWRLGTWQPQYEPVRRLAEGLVKSKRAKKRLVVIAARRLAIDLWLLYTGRCEAGELGLKLRHNR